MSQLQITDSQKTSILDPLDTMLDDAFREGVSAPSFPSTIAKMERYEDLNAQDQAGIRAVFKQVAAALLTSINVNQPISGGGGGGGEITLTGDVTGSGEGSVATTLATVTTAGTATKISYDAKGRVVSGTTLAATDIPDLNWSKITAGKPTTLSGYGITDAAPLSHVGAGGAAHSLATGVAPGFMSSEHVLKLDGIESGANNYTHPAEHPASMIETTGLGPGGSDSDVQTVLGLHANDIASKQPSSVALNNLVSFMATATAGLITRTGANSYGIDTTTYEPAFSKNTGFNKNFGTGAGTVSEGNHTHSSLYQPLDGDLTSIAGLAGTTGLLRKTAANTWSLDTASYLTANQSITLSGDVTGSGTTAITTTLASVGTAGTYRSVTTDSKGRVTAGTNPTTLAGYGITDAQPLDTHLSGLATGLATGATGFVTKTGASSYGIDTTTYVNRAGDAAIAGTLAPATNAAHDLGSSARWWLNSWISIMTGDEVYAGLADFTGLTSLTSDLGAASATSLSTNIVKGITATTLSLSSNVADLGTSVAVQIASDVNLTLAGARLVNFNNRSSTKAYLDKDGNFITTGALQAGTSVNVGVGGINFSNSTHQDTAAPLQERGSYLEIGPSTIFSGVRAALTYGSVEYEHLVTAQGPGTWDFTDENGAGGYYHLTVSIEIGTGGVDTTNPATLEVYIDGNPYKTIWFKRVSGVGVEDYIYINVSTDVYLPGGSTMTLEFTQDSGSSWSITNNARNICIHKFAEDL